jgi:hypothetical protein
LTYETTYTVFFAAPLINTIWDRRLIWSLVKHIVVCLGIMLVVVMIRLMLGEQRIVEVGSDLVNIIRIPIKIGISLIIGPIVSIILFFSGPIKTLFNCDLKLYIIFCSFGVLFSILIRRLINNDCSQCGIVDDGDIFLIKRIVYDRDNDIIRFSIGKYILDIKTEVCKNLLVLLLMLCLSYALSFTHFPPIVRYGRGTAVHLAAALGGGGVYGCICAILLSISNKDYVKKSIILLISLHLSLMLIYQFTVQIDYKKSWNNQRRFWTQVYNLCPDLSDGTMIFVVANDLPETKFILTHSWADPIILRQIFLFPKHWKTPPRLFVVSDNFIYNLGRFKNESEFHWYVPTASWWGHWEILPNSNVIILEMEDGRLVRRIEPICIKSDILNLKKMPNENKIGYDKGYLFHYLIENDQP